jgi:hypothetical protein
VYAVASDVTTVRVRCDQRVDELVRQIDRLCGTGTARRVLADAQLLRHDETLAESGVAPGQLLRLAALSPTEVASNESALSSLPVFADVLRKTLPASLAATAPPPLSSPSGASKSASSASAAGAPSANGSAPLRAASSAAAAGAPPLSEAPLPTDSFYVQVRMPDGTTLRERVSRGETVASVRLRLALARTVLLRVGARTLDAGDTLDGLKDATITVVDSPPTTVTGAPKVSASAAAAAPAAPAPSAAPNSAAGGAAGTNSTHKKPTAPPAAASTASANAVAAPAAAAAAVAPAVVASAVPPAVAAAAAAPTSKSPKTTTAAAGAADSSASAGDAASFAVYFRPRPTPSTLAPNVRVAHTCTAQTTVTELKRALVAHLGAEWRDATLLHGGKPLQPDTATLASCGVRASTALEARILTAPPPPAAPHAAGAATSVAAAPPAATPAPASSVTSSASLSAPSPATIAAGAVIAAGVAAAAASSLDGMASRDAALQDAEKQVIELLTQVAMLTPGEINQLAPEFQQQVLDIRRQLNIQPSGADEDSSAGAASQLLDRLRAADASDTRASAGDTIADAVKRGMPSAMGVVAEAAAALHDSSYAVSQYDARAASVAAAVGASRGARKPAVRSASSQQQAASDGAADDDFLDSAALHGDAHDDDGDDDDDDGDDDDDDADYGDGSDGSGDDDFAGRLAGSTGAVTNAVSDEHGDGDDDDVHGDDGGGALSGSSGTASQLGAADLHYDAASGKIDKMFRLSSDGAGSSDASGELSGSAGLGGAGGIGGGGGGGGDGSSPAAAAVTAAAAAAAGKGLPIKWDDSHTWEIENFVEAVAETLRVKHAQMELPPGEISGIKFRLLVQPKSLHGRGLFSVYLDSGPEHAARQSQWSAKLAFSLRIVNVARPDKASIERTDTNGQTFDHLAPDWGFQDMVDVNTLLDEANGFLVNGALRIQASVTKLRDQSGASKRRAPGCNHLLEWRRVRDALGTNDSPSAWMDALVGTEGATAAEALDKLVELLVHVVQEDDFPELWSEQLTTFAPLTRLFAEHAEPPDVLEVAREAAKLRRPEAARFVVAHGAAVYGDAGFPGEPFIDSLVGSKHVSAEVSLIFLRALPALDKNSNAAVETLRSVFNYTVGELIDERVGKLADFKVYGNNGTKNVAFVKAFPKHRDMYLVAAMAILAIKNPACCAPALTAVLDACLSLNTRLCELDEADATKDLRDVTAVAIRGQSLEILKVLAARRGDSVIAIDINLAGVLLSGNIDILSFVIDSPAFEMENDWWWNAKNVKWCVENSMPAKAQLILARFDSEEAHKSFVELLAEAKGKQRELKELHAFSVAELMPPPAQRRALESFFKDRNHDYVARLVGVMSPAAKQFCADTVVASDWLCRVDTQLWAPFASMASERGQRQALRDFLKANAFDLVRTLSELMPESVRALCARAAIMSDGLRRFDSDLWAQYLAVASPKQLARAFETNHSDCLFASRVNKRAAEVPGGDAAMREIAPRVRLHSFAEAGDVELIAVWLDRGAPIDALRQRGTADTAVLSAVARSQYAVVRLLMERGANVRIVRKPSGENVFHIAADSGDVAMTRQLLYNLRGDKSMLRHLLQQSTAFGRAPAHCTKDTVIRTLLTNAARGVMPPDLAKEAVVPSSSPSPEQVAAAAAATAAAAGVAKGGKNAPRSTKSVSQKQQSAQRAPPQQSEAHMGSAESEDAAGAAGGAGERDDVVVQEPAAAAAAAAAGAAAAAAAASAVAPKSAAAPAAVEVSREVLRVRAIRDAVAAIGPEARRALADDASGDTPRELVIAAAEKARERAVPPPSIKLDELLEAFGITGKAMSKKKKQATSIDPASLQREVDSLVRSDDAHDTASEREALAEHAETLRESASHALSSFDVRDVSALLAALDAAPWRVLLCGAALDSLRGADDVTQMHVVRALVLLANGEWQRVAALELATNVRVSTGPAAATKPARQAAEWAQRCASPRVFRYRVSRHATVYFTVGAWPELRVPSESAFVEKIEVRAVALRGHGEVNADALAARHRHPSALPCVRLLQPLSDAAVADDEAGRMPRLFTAVPHRASVSCDTLRLARHTHWPPMHNGVRERFYELSDAVVTSLAHSIAAPAAPLGALQLAPEQARVGGGGGAPTIVCGRAGTGKTVCAVRRLHERHARYWADGELREPSLPGDAPEYARARRHLRQLFIAGCEAARTAASRAYSALAPSSASAAGADVDLMLNGTHSAEHAPRFVTMQQWLIDLGGSDAVRVVDAESFVRDLWTRVAQLVSEPASRIGAQRAWRAVCDAKLDAAALDSASGLLSREAFVASHAGVADAADLYTLVEAYERAKIEAANGAANSNSSGKAPAGQKKSIKRAASAGLQPNAVPWCDRGDLVFRAWRAVRSATAPVGSVHALVVDDAVSGAELRLCLELCSDANELLLTCESASAAARLSRELRTEAVRRANAALSLRETLMAAEAARDMSDRFGGIGMGAVISPSKSRLAPTDWSAVSPVASAEALAAQRSLADNDTVQSALIGCGRPVSIALAPIADAVVVTLATQQRSSAPIEALAKRIAALEAAVSPQTAAIEATAAGPADERTGKSKGKQQKNRKQQQQQQQQQQQKAVVAAVAADESEDSSAALVTSTRLQEYGVGAVSGALPLLVVRPEAADALLLAVANPTGRAVVVLVRSEAAAERARTLFGGDVDVRLLSAVGGSEFACVVLFDWFAESSLSAEQWTPVLAGQQWPSQPSAVLAELEQLRHAVTRAHTLLRVVESAAHWRGVLAPWLADKVIVEPHESLVTLLTTGSDEVADDADVSLACTPIDVLLGTVDAGADRAMWLDAAQALLARNEFSLAAAALSRTGSAGMQLARVVKAFFLARRAAALPASASALRRAQFLCAAELLVGASAFAARFVHASACLFEAGEFELCALMHEALGDKRRAGTAWTKAGNAEAAAAAFQADAAVRRSFQQSVRRRLFGASADLLAAHPRLLPGGARLRYVEAAATAPAAVASEAKKGGAAAAAASSAAAAEEEAARWREQLPAAQQIAALQRTAGSASALARLLLGARRPRDAVAAVLASSGADRLLEAARFAIEWGNLSLAARLASAHVFGAFDGAVLVIRADDNKSGPGVVARAGDAAAAPLAVLSYVRKHLARGGARLLGVGEVERALAYAAAGVAARDAPLLGRAAHTFAATGNSYGAACALSLCAEARRDGPVRVVQAPPTAASVDGATLSYESSSDDEDAATTGAASDTGGSPAALIAACRAWLRAVDEHDRVGGVDGRGWSALFGVERAANSRLCRVPQSSAALLPASALRSVQVLDAFTLLAEREPLADAVRVHACRQLWRALAQLRAVFDASERLTRWRALYALDTADAAAQPDTRRGLLAASTDGCARLRAALLEIVFAIDVASLAVALLKRRDSFRSGSAAEDWAWLERVAGERDVAVRALHAQVFVFHSAPERRELIAAVREALAESPAVASGILESVVAFFDDDDASRLSSSTVDADAAVMARLGGSGEAAPVATTTTTTAAAATAPVLNDGDAVSGADVTVGKAPTDPYATIAMVELALLVRAPGSALHALWRWQRRRGEWRVAPYGFSSMAVRLPPLLYEERRTMHVAWLLVRASSDAFAQALDCLTMVNLVHEQRMQAQGTPPPLLPIGGLLELVERSFARLVPLMFGGQWRDNAAAKAPSPAKPQHKRGGSTSAASESDESARSSVLLPRSLQALYVADDALVSGGASAALQERWLEHTRAPASAATLAMAVKALAQLGTLWTLLLPQYLDAAFAVSSAVGEQSLMRVATVIATVLANQCWRGAFARGCVLEQIVVFQALVGRYAANAPEAQLSTDDLDLLPPMLGRTLRRLKVGGPRSLVLSAPLRALIGSVGSVPLDVRGGVHVMQKLAAFLESCGDELVECRPVGASDSDESGEWPGVGERLTTAALAGGRLDRLLYQQLTAALQSGAGMRSPGADEAEAPSGGSGGGGVVPPALLAVSDSVRDANLSESLLTWRAVVALHVSASVIQSAWRASFVRRGSGSRRDGGVALAVKAASLRFASVERLEAASEAALVAYAQLAHTYRRGVAPLVIAVARRVDAARVGGGVAGGEQALVTAIAAGWRDLLEQVAQLHATRHAQWRGAEYQCNVARDALRVHVAAIESAEVAHALRSAAHAAGEAVVQSSASSSVVEHEFADDLELLADDAAAAVAAVTPPESPAADQPRRTKTKRNKSRKVASPGQADDAGDAVTVRGALSDADMGSAWT